MIKPRAAECQNRAIYIFRVVLQCGCSVQYFVRTLTASEMFNCVQLCTKITRSVHSVHKLMSHIVQYLCDMHVQFMYSTANALSNCIRPQSMNDGTLLPVQKNFLYTRTSFYFNALGVSSRWHGTYPLKLIIFKV